FQKTKKLKISKVKTNNQKRTKLSKQGKLKLQRHKQPKKQIQKPPQLKPEDNQDDKEEEESDHGEDMLSMVEKDDMDFLESAVNSKSYNILKKIRFNDTTSGDDKKRRKRKLNKDDTPIEDEYEETATKLEEEKGNKRVRMLLPVKTSDGFIKNRTIEEEVVDDDDDENNDENKENKQDEKEEKEIDSDEEVIADFEPEIKDTEKEKISTIELYACREEVLRSKKFKIGLLSSALLENPELKKSNFKALLDLMEERNPEVKITVRKIATVSLFEVFKDLLPSYLLNQTKEEGVKYKKETLLLYGYEETLLQSYKRYLTKLEKMSDKLRKKKGETKVLTLPGIILSEIALTCMCELLVTHPYFNYSTNIANFLVPFLDNKRPSVREKVFNCMKNIFKDDKRGELSLVIVRKLNQYIKQRGHSVHTELVQVLLSLRIKDIDLDKERDDEMKQKKLMSHKQRILALSKRERKKSKKLEAVEKELLETKAEENKVEKQKILTEITSIVFTIYFRILKQAPNSQVLSVCLEGLAKFAHCINLEFYQDLVNVINTLMEEKNLGLREQLHCIQTVFTILSGQGSALNIDPYRFYVHLYKNLLSINAGKNQQDCLIIIKILIQVLINRRKKITQNRLIAFIKRIATMSLQLQHHGSLGLLGIIKIIMHLTKSIEGLLDTDANSGDGFYQPELDEPECCNAYCTSLWELVALQRHYHSVVQKISRNIAAGVPVNGDGCLPPEYAKLKPEDLYEQFDPTGVVFNPSIPVPKKAPQKNIKHHEFANFEFGEYVENICKQDDDNDDDDAEESENIKCNFYDCIMKK
ncbi:nucleolar complex protein 3 homolog, partial [Aphidius gifuensis]|uniref:nucleolar complex protein 3 homolog n=1 Tax=Aphidius gifuensis TaxID=684658 RepID=UPI001CDCDF06